MCSCLRQTKSLPRKFLISSRISSLKYFSALSTAQDKFRSNCDRSNLITQKIPLTNQIQHKNFSVVESLNNFYESLRSSEVSQLTKQVLIDTHDFTGLSWCSTLILASSVMKLLISLPAGIFQQFLVSKLELTKIELDQRVPKIRQDVLEKGTKAKWSSAVFQMRLRREITKEWKYLVVKNNCHPFKGTILFLLQFPFWLILTVTIRTLALDASFNKLGDLVTALHFKVGGPFWCRNLAVPDPWYILPTINLLTLLAITEISVAATSSKVPPTVPGLIMSKVIPNLSRLLAVFFFFISAVSPSGLSLFWATNTVFALSQNLLLMSPRVRRFLRIPVTPSEKARPYKQAWDSTVERWTKLFSKEK